jgi:uncharacterized membrane protein (UPF0127 family)
MKKCSLLLLALSLTAACHRLEEPPSVSSAESESTAAASAERSAPPARSAAEAAPVATAEAALAATGTSPTAASASAITSSTAAASAITPPACVVPLPSAAPAPQKPAAKCPPDPGPVPTLARSTLHFKEAPGKIKLNIERALSPAEHERGLMYRTKLPENQGMLFEWPNETRRVFWMHNTCIPLDMLFIAKDGTIAGILEQVPTMNDAPRTIACSAGYVLEVNAGWCRRHGVKPGTHVTFE